MKGGVHRPGAAKVSGGLHDVDVLVQVLRETVLRRADEHMAVDSVLPQMEFLHATSESRSQNGDRRGW